MEMDKLIQHLRFCGDLEANCHECERYYEMGADGGTASCVNDLMQKAADVLEELRAHIDALESERQAWLHDQEINRWIPVTERLPDLIPCSAGTGYSEAVIVWTSGRKAMIAVWDGTDFLCAADYWDAEGETITHWMPLPELPKEGA